MRNIIRYWNQNRKKIIIILAIVAFIIILIMITNEYLKNANYNESTADGKIMDVKKPNKSAITGETIPKEVVEKNSNLIENFINYCNNKEIEKAYNLLTDDCKSEFNNDIYEFRDNYFNNIFGTSKAYRLELWGNEAGYYTYKITYYEDNLLATGGQSLNNNIEDYITITRQNGEDKLNIGCFIKKQEINKAKSLNNIDITVNNRRVYKSYEKYIVTIKNNGTTNITISDGKNNSDICIIDNNNTKYVSYISEILDSKLTIEPGRQTQLEIKFNKIYNSYKSIKQMEFSNIKQENSKINIKIEY